MDNTATVTPIMDTRATGTPAMVSLVMIILIMDTPAMASTDMGSPVMASLAMGIPVMDTPAINTTRDNQSRDSPGSNRQAWSSPARGYQPRETLATATTARDNTARVTLLRVAPLMGNTVGMAGMNSMPPRGIPVMEITADTETMAMEMVVMDTAARCTTPKRRNTEEHGESREDGLWHTGLTGDNEGTPK